jgi:hypothetical protein
MAPAAAHNRQRRLGSTHLSSARRRFPAAFPPPPRSRLAVARGSSNCPWGWIPHINRELFAALTRRRFADDRSHSHSHIFERQMFIWGAEARATEATLSSAHAHTPVACEFFAMSLQLVDAAGGTNYSNRGRTRMMDARGSNKATSNTT